MKTLIIPDIHQDLAGLKKIFKIENIYIAYIGGIFIILDTKKLIIFENKLLPKSLPVPYPPAVSLTSLQLLFL